MSAVSATVPPGIPPSIPSRHKGKVALITGAARGMGRSHAIRLASEGADLALLDLCAPIDAAASRDGMATPDDLQETVRLVENLGLGTRVRWRHVDVRDLEGLEAFATDAVEHLGRLDTVVSNAGICTYGRWDQITPESWQAVLDVNLTGTFYTVRATVPHMVRQGDGGAVILISSTSGLRGHPFILPYVAAKHGVTGLAKALANELGGHRIRVTSLHPGEVDTPGADIPGLADIVASNQTEYGDLFTNALPYEVIPPEDISAAVAWLASDEGRMVTGAQIIVDMGALNR